MSFTCLANPQVSTDERRTPHDHCVAREKIDVDISNENNVAAERINADVRMQNFDNLMKLGSAKTAQRNTVSWSDTENTSAITKHANAETTFAYKADST